MNEPAMTEAQIRELFSAAVDGELKPDEQAAFEEALSAAPALAAEYQAFAETVMRLRRVVQAPSPNLLPGIQRRLRTRSRGRYYADRFSESVGVRLTQPLLVALVMLALFAMAWIGLRMFDAPRPLNPGPRMQQSP